MPLPRRATLAYHRRPALRATQIGGWAGIRRWTAAVLLIGALAAGGTGCHPSAANADQGGEGPVGSSSIDGITDGGDGGDGNDGARVVAVVPGTESEGGVPDGAPGTPSGPPGCSYTLSDATGTLLAVPPSALGPAFRCRLQAVYDVPKNNSLLELQDDTPSGDAIPGSDIRVSWTFGGMPSYFDLLGSDLGASPGIVLQSGASNTSAPLVGLLFSSGAARKTPVAQGFGNDWINPAVDPVHGPLQQGDWTITLTSIVLTDDHGTWAGGDTAHFYTVTGTGIFHMIFDDTVTHQTASITASVSFKDAYQLN